MTQSETQVKTAAREDAGTQGFVDILTFLIPCLQFIQVQLVGKLNGTDILIAVVFVYLAVRLRFRIAAPVGKWLLALCLVWLASQILTDIVRRSPFADYARGWSNIGMTFAYLAVLWTLLYGRPRRIVIYGWGLVLGTILMFLISPDEGAAKYPWKFGLARPLSLAVFLLASRKECRGLLPIMLATVMGLINIAFGARSMGGSCLAAALYLIVNRLMRRRSAKGLKLRARSIMVFATSIIVGLAGVLWVYQLAASQGILGEDARSEYEGQSSGRFGMLLGGRVDMLGAFAAIYDSPILGHGSWAKDPKYLLAEQQAMALMDYTNTGGISSEEMEEGIIPSHSFILGAWVDAGILGACFWVWVLVLTVKSLSRVYPPSVEILPLVSLSAFVLLWDLLFSPYGAVMRIISTYNILVLMTGLSLATPAADQVLAAKLKRPIKAVSKRKSLGESARA